MPGAIFFTHATDAHGVRDEFVRDLRDRAKAHEAAARTAGEKDKKAALAAAVALNEAAAYWESVLIGNPVQQAAKAQQTTGATAARAGLAA